MAGPRHIGGPPEVEVYRSRSLRKRPASPGFDRALERLLEQPQPDVKPSAPSELSFSRHASARLESRGIVLDQAELGRLAEAVDQLAGKGSREALVITADNAYVVGVEKRTVITAMPRSEALGTVFTQIDSTYVAP